MKNRILNNWSLMRVIRLAVGLYIIYQAVVLKEYFLLLLAGIFLYQAIWNVSPCGMGGSCEVKPKTKIE